MFFQKVTLDEVEKCILSHHHEDHYAGASELMEIHGIPVYATLETALLIRLNIRIPPERALVWGIPEPCKVKILRDMNEIKTSTSKFKLIHSPGHCNNLISIFQEKTKLLFSTDAMMDKNQSVIFNWENANLMLDTFKKFEKLKPEYLFSSNGNVFSGDDLHYLINYWMDIKEKSTKLYSNGMKPKQIVKKIFSKESWLKVSTRGDMSRENLIRSLLNLAPIFKNRRFNKNLKK
jgi:Cft2 family RNA processing exonuclease